MLMGAGNMAKRHRDIIDTAERVTTRPIIATPEREGDDARRLSEYYGGALFDTAEVRILIPLLLRRYYL